MNTHIHLVDPNFQSQHSGKCDLHIHIGQNMIKYAVIDKGREQVKALVAASLKAGDSEITEADDFLTDNKLGSLHFRKVKISVETTKFTFIPNELYAEQDKLNYSRFIGPQQETDVIQNDIKKLKLKNISAVDSALQDLLKSHFRQPQLLSQADPFITGTRMLYANRTETVIYLNISLPTFEAAVIKEGRLLFYNLFGCSTPDEFNYFILLMLEQLNLDPAESEIIIAGDISRGDEYYQRLEKYFSNIVFAGTSKLVMLTGIFSEIEPHRHFSLFALGLCE